MRIWIDCEFNSYLGELISLALVTETGDEFYRVVEMNGPVDPWVAENVMTVLMASPIPLAQLHEELEAFLKPYSTVHVIADWTEDIGYFVRALTTGPGTRLDTPPLTMEIVRYDAPSTLPHNALADARGIREHMLALEREGYRLERLVITDAPKLDEITVFLEDLRPGAGRITVECYGRAWSAAWGGLGKRTIRQFIEQADVSYLSGKLEIPRMSKSDIAYLQRITEAVISAVNK